MSDQKLNILFLGTPDFAVESLKILVENGLNIVGVVTAPDKPSGRGLEIHETPVKKYAVEAGLKVFQPEKLKSPEFLEEMRNLDIDLGIVVAFRMMPEVLWSMPKLGTFNLHASLLPQYRGSAPINWAIINGEDVTGVTTFFLKHEIDTGMIVYQERVAIKPDETAGELYQRLMFIGAELVLKTVQDIEKGDYPQIHQAEIADAKVAPKLYKETAQIDFKQKANAIYNFIRGMNPFPGAWFDFKGKKMILYKVDIVLEHHQHEFGELITDNKSFIHVYCSDGYIVLKEFKMEGKRMMNVVDFLNGTKLN